MSEMIENVYDTEDEERTAHTATYANMARYALWRHICDADLMEAAVDSPWADKVCDLLEETMRTLEEMADRELLHRPDVKEAGRAYQEAFLADHAGAIAEMDALEERRPIPSEPSPPLSAHDTSGRLDLARDDA